MEDDFEALRAKLHWDAILEPKYMTANVETGWFHSKIKRFEMNLIQLWPTNCFIRWLVNVFVIQINDKQRLSGALERLNRLYPPDSTLLHLKRVKAVPSPDSHFRLMVTLADRTTKEEVKQRLVEIDYECLSVDPVPKSKPLTRPQFERAKQLWPVSFFENK